MSLTRPHDGPYDAANASARPHSYCVSPSGSTAARPRRTSRSLTASSRQTVAVPAPPLKNELVGSQAMSPAAAITGSLTAAVSTTSCGAVAAPLSREATLRAVVDAPVKPRPVGPPGFTSDVTSSETQAPAAKGPDEAATGPITGAVRSVSERSLHVVAATEWRSRPVDEALVVYRRRVARATVAIPVRSKRR